MKKSQAMLSVVVPITTSSIVACNQQNWSFCHGETSGSSPEQHS